MPRPLWKGYDSHITSTDVKAVIAKTHLSDTSESDPLLGAFWGQFVTDSPVDHEGPGSVGRALWSEATLAENLDVALGHSAPNVVAALT